MARSVRRVSRPAAPACATLTPFVPEMASTPRSIRVMTATRIASADPPRRKAISR
jgi:hypothetical protein